MGISFIKGGRDRARRRCRDSVTADGFVLSPGALLIPFLLVAHRGALNPNMEICRAVRKPAINANKLISGVGVTGTVCRESLEATPSGGNTGIPSGFTKITAI